MLPHISQSEVDDPDVLLNDTKNHENELSQMQKNFVSKIDTLHEKYISEFTQFSLRLKDLLHNAWVSYQNDVCMNEQQMMDVLLPTESCKHDTLTNTEWDEKKKPIHAKEIEDRLRHRLKKLHTLSIHAVSQYYGHYVQNIYDLWQEKYKSAYIQQCQRSKVVDNVDSGAKAKATATANVNVTTSAKASAKAFAKTVVEKPEKQDDVHVDRTLIKKTQVLEANKHDNVTTTRANEKHGNIETMGGNTEASTSASTSASKGMENDHNHHSVMRDCITNAEVSPCNARTTQELTKHDKKHKTMEHIAFVKDDNNTAICANLRLPLLSVLNSHSPRDECFKNEYSLSTPTQNTSSNNGHGVCVSSQIKPAQKRTHHQMMINHEIDVKPYECLFCPENFSSGSELRMHESKKHRRAFIFNSC